MILELKENELRHGLGPSVTSFLEHTCWGQNYENVCLGSQNSWAQSPLNFLSSLH